LVLECAGGSVEDLNLYVYRQIVLKITGWPLGNKPNDYEDLTSNKKLIRRQSLIREKVLIFSPHPDDDVISMGGTLRKLVEQGNEVHVAYMTSGANGVNDL
jgi:glucosamine-6-phosphate deaminase